MLSVNQMQAQIKLTELWKAFNTENNPLKFKHQVAAENGRESRAVSNKTLVLNKGSKLTNDSFLYDASKLWNNAPEDLKNTKTFGNFCSYVSYFHAVSMDDSLTNIG